MTCRSLVWGVSSSLILCCCREYYTEEHYRSLVRFEAAHLQRPYRTERCVDVHGPNCQLGCRSCHSCRYRMPSSIALLSRSSTLKCKYKEIQIQCSLMRAIANGFSTTSHTPDHFSRLLMSPAHHPVSCWLRDMAEMCNWYGLAILQCLPDIEACCSPLWQLAWCRCQK